MSQPKSSKKFSITKLLYLACTIVGAITLFIGARDYLWAKDSVDWPRVKGEVLSSYIKSSSKKYRAMVEFGYSVEGKEYIGNLICFTYDGHATTSTAESYVNDYSEGSTVNVYYNPSSPSVSVLKPGLRDDYWLVPTVGFSMFFVGIWSYRQHSRTSRS